VQPHTQAHFNQETSDDHHAVAIVDTSIPEQIEAYVQWNNAKTGNTFTLGQGYMKEVS
jgi:nanoRNase/pAp phosphatase (c-di-AMP/oligoRNAs hydrolase)